MRSSSRRRTSTSGAHGRLRKAFFTEELRERVTGLYGVSPSIEFVQIAEIVDNSRS